MNLRQALTAAPLLALLGSAAAHADDVTDQIQEALKAYENKDLGTAAAALDAASSLIRQMKAESLGSLLPAPPAGWEAEEAQTAGGVGPIVGGIHAERSYHKGEQSVKVAITGNSPLLQMMAMVFNNPMAMGADNKLVIVDGRKVIYNKSDNAYRVLVGNQALVEVSGEHGVDEATLKTFLKGVNFAGVETAVK